MSNLGADGSMAVVAENTHGKTSLVSRGSARVELNGLGSYNLAQLLVMSRIDGAISVRVCVCGAYVHGNVCACIWVRCEPKLMAAVLCRA